MGALSPCVDTLRRQISKGSGGACLVQIVVLSSKSLLVILVTLSKVAGVVSDEEIAFDFD